MTTTKTTKLNLSDLLKPAGGLPIRMKLFLYGDSGAGKTYSALMIANAIGGKVAVLDPEDGSRLYADKFQFDLLRSDDIEVLQATIRMLAQGGHEYRTLIIDPITLLWRAWQEQWEDRFANTPGRASRGAHAGWYELQLKDWGPVKRTWEALMRLLVKLDMNVIVTAREKALFDSSGDSMKKVGETFDGEKSLPYWFDTRVRILYRPSGKRHAFTERDRTGLLPPQGPAWEWDPMLVAKVFAGREIERPVASTLAAAETLEEIRALGVRLDLSERDLNGRCRAKWGRASLDELTPAEAEEALAGLRAAVERKIADAASEQAQ